MSNVIALSNFSVPSDEPIQGVIDILEELLAKAKDGRIVAVATVSVERDPPAYELAYHAEPSAHYSLGSGVLGLHGKFSRIMSEGE